MADYPISNVPRRIVYTGSAGVGPYAFDFEVLLNTDIKVYKNDTLLTLTTNYTVSISPTLGTGSVTLVSAATGSDRITIVGARAVERTTDFTTGGDFFANSMNDELDSQTILVQQVAETAERSIKAPVTDPTNINMVLPTNTARAGKTLAFDASGNPVAGDPIGIWRGDWDDGVSYQNRDLVKDTTNSNVYLATVAHTSSGSLPISTNADSAKWALVIDAAAADASADAAAASAILANDWATKTSGAVAGGEYSAKYHAQAAASSASDAQTAETNAESAQTAAEAAKTAAESARDQTLTAFDSFDDRYLGTKTSDPSVDNDGNALLAGALYFNSTSGIMKVYTGSAWVAAYVSGLGFVPQTSTTGSAQIPTGTTGQRDGSPAAGYLRFNSTLSKPEVYNGTAWGSVGGGATGAGGDEVFVENSQTVTTSYTLSTSKNAMSVGPITINSGATVTVPSGQRWVVLQEK